VYRIKEFENMNRITVSSLVLLAGMASPALAQGTGQTGPSTTASAYMVPSSLSSGVSFVSIATSLVNEFHTNLDTGVANSYRLVGIPDGMGVYRDEQDIRDNTFSLLVNHELGDDRGIVRAHGNRGALVSQWRIRRGDLSVVGGRDLITNTNLFNMTTNSYNNFNSASAMPDYVQSAGNAQGWGAVNTDGFGRFCSADLAPVSAFQWTDASGATFGTADRIFLNGEERGPSGRAFAHIVTGSEARTAYELPALADFSWENTVASPHGQRKTIVAGLDDSTGGELYFYVGDKQNSGNVVDRAGLTNGKTYGMAVTGIASELTGSVFNSTPFTMVDLSTHQLGTGDNFEVVSGAAGVTSFARPEDGAWNPSNPNEFFWVTTGTGGVPTRLFRTSFTDINNPLAGGTVTVVGQGNDQASFTGGFASATGATTADRFDNIAMSRFNQVLIQEDVGGVDRLGRIWLYDATVDSLVEVGISESYFFGDSDLLTPGLQARLTNDEETSGIIDAWDILGPGWWLLNMQAHYGIAGELVEGGQLMAAFIPQTVPTPASAALLALGGLLAARRRRSN